MRADILLVLSVIILSPGFLAAERPAIKAPAGPQPIGVLTAAFPELTPRSVRDPDRAIADWAAFAREVGAALVLLFAFRREAVERATAPPLHR